MPKLVYKKLAPRRYEATRSKSDIVRPLVSRSYKFSYVRSLKDVIIEHRRVELPSQFSRAIVDQDSSRRRYHELVDKGLLGVLPPAETNELSSLKADLRKQLAPADMQISPAKRLRDDRQALIAAVNDVLGTLDDIRRKRSTNHPQKPK